MTDVVGIGLSCVDLIIAIDGFPQEDSKKAAEELFQQGGGPCSTALVTLCMLGAETRYIGTIGSDSFAAYMRNELEGYGVDISNLNTIPSSTSTLAVVLVNKQKATRTIVWKKGNVPSPTEQQINLDILNGAKVLHLDGHHVDASKYAALYARRNGIKVSLDAGNLFDRIDELVCLTDFLVTSEDFALKSTGEQDSNKAAVALYKKYNPEVVVITCGSKGGVCFDGKNLDSYPAYSIKVVDSTGAGDVFHGAFIYGYLQHWDWLKICNFASAVSALKCTKLGGRTGIPTISEVYRFINDRGLNI